DALPNRLGGLAVIESSAHPDSRLHLIPRAALTTIIEERQVLAEQARAERPARAQRQAAFVLTINSRTQPKIGGGIEAERQHDPQEQTSPRPAGHPEP